MREDEQALLEQKKKVARLLRKKNEIEKDFSGTPWVLVLLTFLTGVCFTGLALIINIFFPQAQAHVIDSEILLWLLGGEILIAAFMLLKMDFRFKAGVLVYAPVLLFATTQAYQHNDYYYNELIIPVIAGAGLLYPLVILPFMMFYSSLDARTRYPMFRRTVKTGLVSSVLQFLAVPVILGGIGYAVTQIFPEEAPPFAEKYWWIPAIVVVFYFIGVLRYLLIPSTSDSEFIVKKARSIKKYWWFVCGLVFLAGEALLFIYMADDYLIENLIVAGLYFAALFTFVLISLYSMGRIISYFIHFRWLKSVSDEIYKIEAAFFEKKRKFGFRGYRKTIFAFSGFTVFVFFIIMGGLWVSRNNNTLNEYLFIGANSSSTNYRDIIKLSKKGADMNATDEKGNTPLHWSVIKSNHYIIEGLIKHGADVNAINDRGNTPLHLAVCYPYTDNGPQILLEHGADLGIKNFEGKTPLFAAVERGVYSFSDWLILKGADVNTRDNHGITPLHMAVAKGMREYWIKKLIESGADVNAFITKDYSDGILEFKKGDTPLDHARGYDTWDILVRSGAKTGKELHPAE